MEQHDAVANLDRMRAIAAYDLFDPGLAGELRSICRRTADRLGLPLAAVQVVLDGATAVLATNDENDLLTTMGGAPREHSLCVNVVQDRAPYVVEDLADHPEHADNPGLLLGLIRAYAGVPLVLPGGEILGTHCVMSPQPRPFGHADLAELRTAADEILRLIVRH
ncbi:GAF domain-containing protein [Actinoplanes sp. NPDC049265]|uniref:GAF domain-containing protein n=1 Tax=Actinoplanes sp. NPDC049265 TaxID=3363902 RepID=UPI00371616FA